jgi:hypothetical protein
MVKAEFRYNPREAQAGRFSPTWQVQTQLRDYLGRPRELEMVLNSEGRIIKGLEKLPLPIIRRVKEKAKK